MGMKPEKIRLFIKPYCGWCHEAIEWLDKRGIPYEVLDVISDARARKEMFQLSGQTLAPTIDVDGEILGSYWDKETKYVKEKYKTIVFPFKEISVPTFKTSLFWNLNQLWYYMKTWSSVKKYYSENKRDPLDLVKPEVKALWGDEFDKKEVTWNINIRAGIIK